MARQSIRCDLLELPSSLPGKLFQCCSHSVDSFSRFHCCYCRCDCEAVSIGSFLAYKHQFRLKALVYCLHSELRGEFLKSNLRRACCSKAPWKRGSLLHDDRRIRIDGKRTNRWLIEGSNGEGDRDGVCPPVRWMVERRPRDDREATKATSGRDRVATKATSDSIHC